jgi:hypothetical protein
MPAALDTLALFDLATLKEHCKATDPVDVVSENTLVRIGNGASAYCEERTSRIFKQRTLNLVASGNGKRTLLMLKRPIISIASLTIDGVAVDPSEYVIWSEKGTIELKTRTFTVGIGNIALTYDAGYATSSTDPQLRQVTVAALDLAKAHWDEFSAGAMSLSSITVGPASAIIKPGLNPRIEKYLDSIADVRG